VRLEPKRYDQTFLVPGVFHYKVTVALATSVDPPGSEVVICNKARVGLVTVDRGALSLSTLDTYSLSWRAMAYTYLVDLCQSTAGIA
jgi:hypothetical protein